MLALSERALGKMARYSIVTVLLNDPDGFRRTAESIAEQTCRNFEWIVIDGGSGFATQSVIRNYAHSIDTFVSGKDNGIYDAMMKGVRLASGRWTIFMNAGDCFSNKHVLSAISNSPERDMIYGLAYWKPKPGVRTHYMLRNIDDIWQGNAYSHQSFFCKTDLIRRLGFNKNLKIVADYDFYLRAFDEGATIAGTNFVIAEVEGGGLSDRKFYQRTVERFFVVRRRFKDKPILRFYLGLIYKKAIKDVGAFVQAVKA